MPPFVLRTASGNTPEGIEITCFGFRHRRSLSKNSPPSLQAATKAKSASVSSLRRAGRDPHMIWTTRIDALYGLVSMMERASDRAGNLNGHVLYLYGAHDQIIPRVSANNAARRLPSSARTALYANGYHWLLRDLQREVVYADIEAFLRNPDAAFPSDAPPIIPSVQAAR